MPTSYNPFKVTFLNDSGVRVAWDRYPSRRAAVNAIKSDAELFGLTDAEIEFNGRYSKYPTQDAEISKMGAQEAAEMIGWYSSRVAEVGYDGRSLNTCRAYIAGCRVRLAELAG